MSLEIKPAVVPSVAGVVTPTAAPLDLAEMPAEDGFNDFEKNPSDWEIQGLEDGISARNNKTGRVFEGQMLSFNKMLRG